MHRPVVNFYMRLIWLVLVAATIVACGSPPVVPVSERRVVTQIEKDEEIGGNLIRVVQPGDTLYSIAFSAGLSVNDIAAWNGISSSFQIHVGQTIRLTKPANFVPRRTIVSAPVRDAPVVAQSKPQTQSKIPKTTSKPSVSKPIPAVNNSIAPVWGWPMKGKIIRGYYPAVGRKGVDILGNKGQSVVAASDGSVVYVGNGLRGYGNLIIIKHSQDFLSAYANNKSIKVSQGQSVKRGSIIGEVGRNESGQYVLHFQIRKKGKPVDPKLFLLKN